MFIVAVLVATILWFLVASVLFFNPLVDKIYRSQEGHAGVRTLPQSGKTIGVILLAVVVQSVLWAYVYTLIGSALGGGKLWKGVTFGLILALTKIIPRDIDRILLTTYPRKRMTIEFIIGIICSFVVGIVFGYLL